MTGCASVAQDPSYQLLSYVVAALMALYGLGIPFGTPAGTRTGAVVSSVVLSWPFYELSSVLLAFKVLNSCCTSGGTG